MTHSLYDAIPIIMDRFDFEKIQKVMAFLNWRWLGTGVPSIHQLKSTAHEMLSGCVQMFEEKGRPATGMVWSTGGFTATVQCFDNGAPRLDLVFYVEHWSSTGEY